MPPLFQQQKVYLSKNLKESEQALRELVESKKSSVKAS